MRVGVCCVTTPWRLPPGACRTTLAKPMRHPAHAPSRRPPPARRQGGNVGLMGAVAEAVGRGLGEDHVIGVIPAALEPREVGGAREGSLG